MNGTIKLLVSSVFLSFPLAAVAQEAPAAQQPGGIMSVLPMMAIMFVIIYFFMIRPEQKKQKERAELLKNIKKGDKVLTAGGIIGVVGNIKGNSVMIKIADSTTVEVTKSAVTAVLNGENAEKDSDKGEKK